MEAKLFKAVDNSQLIIFRIIFGFLITCESWGAIATGWVKRVLIDPEFTFNFIPFSFLQPLSGNGMYFYFGLMGLMGVFMMIGYRYVLASIGFFVLWSGVYFMQKSAYNNHYYLLFLLNLIMIFLPANKDLSVDANRGIIKKANVMPNWVWLLIIAQLAIVYTFASVAKIYPDWLDTTVPRRLMASRANYPIVGELLQQKWAHYIIAYFGILFDLLIVPALLYKPTRKWAFGLAVFFHIYNSIIFQIGIFPYLALGFTVFFFPAEKIRKWFYPKSKKEEELEERIFKKSNLIQWIIVTWLIIQILLPIRHWFIKGDVLWTEEGHRMSWRMMLRSKHGYNYFKIKEKGSTILIPIKSEDYLTKKQIRSMIGKPDMIWQFAQHLKGEYQKQNKDIEVYVNSWVGVNGSTKRQFINQAVDLGSVEWSWWKHNDWILPIHSIEK